MRDLLSPPVRFRFPPLSPSSYSTTSPYLGPPRIDRRWTSVADYISGRRGRKSRRREVNLRVKSRVKGRITAVFSLIEPFLGKNTT